MAVRNDNGLIGLDNILKSMDAYTEGRVVDVVSDLVQSLRDATPLGDEAYAPGHPGMAKNSWKVSVDSYTASSATGEAPYIGGVEINMSNRNTGRFLAAPGKGKALPGFDIRKSSNIVVYSDIPYMARLNRGWSPKAEPGFIERVIDQVTSRWGLL